MIVLHCSKESGEVKFSHFEGILGKIKERINSERKLVNYLGKTNLVLHAGGQIDDILHEKEYATKCQLGNLAPEVSRQDL